MLAKIVLAVTSALTGLALVVGPVQAQQDARAAPALSLEIDDPAALGREAMIAYA